MCMALLHEEDVFKNLRNADFRRISSLKQLSSILFDVNCSKEIELNKDCPPFIPSFNTDEELKPHIADTA